MSESNVKENLDVSSEEDAHLYNMIFFLECCSDSSSIHPI